ncbi:MAG: DUF6498-containing protein [Trueperaceae bacterium]|nr:DUF6498-containing protein [Trueperaceae bacterium]
MGSSRVAVAALVAANLVPLVGVALLGWRLYDVMLLFWLENGVIGAYNLARMATAGQRPASALFLAPFFTVHYGMFWVVHGVFVVELFGGAGSMGGAAGAGAAGLGSGVTLPLVGTVPAFAGIEWALLGLALSHGASFVQNWWLGGERRDATPAERMRAPYGRVVVLHLTILGGGVAVQALGEPAAALLLLIVLKTFVDVAAHVRAHRPEGPIPLRGRPAG